MSDAPWLREVTDDLYSMAERIKEIDSRYRLCFNLRLHRYEIYASGALQLAVPPRELDARVAQKLRRTRVERKDALMREIDLANRAAERAAEKLAFERAAERAEKEGLCL